MAKKDTSNEQYGFITVILILAGTISHSNGVDDITSQSSDKMLFSVCGILLVAVLVYLIWNVIEKYVKQSKIT